MGDAVEHDPDGAAAGVYFAGGLRELTGQLVEMLGEDDRNQFGPRRRCGIKLREVIGWPDDRFCWGAAAAYAQSADLRWTVEAIHLLATDAGALANPGHTRWMGDTEAAIHRAIGHESVEQIAEQHVQHLLDAGVDDGRARYWLTAQDPLIGYFSPLDMIHAGYPTAVEMARDHLLATLPDL